MICKSLLLLGCLLGAALAEKSPVLVWKSDSPLKPTFYTMSQEEFSEIMKPKAKDNMFVVFQESGLSYSDFACSKSSKSTRDSCFSNLKGVAPKTFYTSVENPVEAIRQVSTGSESAYIDEEGNLDHEISYEPGKVVFVDLESESSDGLASTLSREKKLEMHDEIIEEIIKKLTKDKANKITAIYTRTPSTGNDNKIRHRRAAADKATSGTMFRSSKDFLIFYTEFLLQQENAEKKIETTKITFTEMNLSGKNATAFTVNLIGGTNKLSFLISSDHGYFKMSDLMFDNEKYYVPYEVTSPTDFSYSCGNQTFIINKADSTKKIVWNSLQMQAPFNENVKEDFKFGDAWYCVGFFSSGILAGLFVVFILLGIMSVGICWMLDINTMDRFDDPKGKTITVNVNE